MIPRISRRRTLGLIAAGAAGAAFTGCQVQTSSDQAGGGAPKIEFPDTGAELPDGETKLRWLDGGGNLQLFQKPLFDAYHSKHDNITVQYDGTNMDTLNETVPLGVRNGTAPDVFAIGNKIQHREAVQSGWCQPIEDLVADFDNWKKAFPEGAFVPGEHIVDGKVYSFPLLGSGETAGLLIYSVALVKQAGVDPTRDLQTWDDFRSVAKKITGAGKGKFYGLMNSRTPVKIADALLATSGWRGGMDLRTGRYAYTASEVADVVELLQAINKDKSIWPDYAGISAADARGRMSNDVAGLQVDGPYSFADWENADWDFDFQLMPTPEGKKDYTESYSQGAGSNVFVFKDAKFPQVAGDLFSYMGSLEGQTQLVVQSRGALLPSMPQAQDKAVSEGADIDPHFSKVRKLSEQVMRAAPSPVIRNPDNSKVEVETIKPGWSDLLGGMLTGQVTDMKSELRKLNDKLDKALDSAIATAKKKGAKVSREDYVFDNWDPAKDYTKADYEAL